MGRVTKIEIVIVVVILVLMGLEVYGLVNPRHSAKDACVERGGIVNEYNCGPHGCASWQCVGGRVEE